MSEQMPPAPPAPAARVKTRLQKIRIAREQSLFGPAEIIALAGSLFVFVLVIVSYFYFLLPAKSRLDTLQAERALLQTELRTSQQTVQEGVTTEASVQKIAASLDNFENNELLSADRGRMSLYDALNVLIRKNGLRNTSGPTYTPLEPANSKNGNLENKTTNTKWQSLYPGIAISVTVEGQYQNLRRFVRDLETNRQFIIINSVELERSTEANNTLPAEGDPVAAANAAVSLRLELTTYFQRAGSNDSSAPPAH
jgi:Tfp pilus assembly protein PilO